MQRRSFIAGALGGLTVGFDAGGLFGAALANPTSLSKARAAGGSHPAGRVLVVVNLDGGNDGLNTVVPHGSRAYYAARPTLAIPARDVIRLDGAIGLAPALAALRPLWDQGKLAVVQGVGYPSPDHSHFRSTEIWQTASPDRPERTGWLGRYADAAPPAAPNLFDAVAVSRVVPAALVAASGDVPAIPSLESLAAASAGAGATAAVTGAMPFASPYFGAVATIQDDARRGARELPSLIAGYVPGAAYPATAIGRSLALAAQIIGSRIGTRVIYVQHGSYDTHVSQGPAHAILLAELAGALAAFQADLAAHGEDGRTLTLTFSEFGRRVAENASRGTDHGEAAPLFVMGAGVRGGVYGEHPSLQALDRGDLVHTTDFRSVYATVLEGWFGRAHDALLGAAFPLLPLLR